MQRLIDQIQTKIRLAGLPAPINKTLRVLLDWRLLLSVSALAIVALTIYYSDYVSKKIMKEQRQRVEHWATASRIVADTNMKELELPIMIKNEQHSIPIIEADEKDSIISYTNLDPEKAAQTGFLEGKLKQFRADSAVISLTLANGRTNYYYYGNTPLFNEVRYFPLIQLLLVTIFISLIIYTINMRSIATQNQVWAGMAKETAHQLGTPITSLQGWLEILKEDPSNDPLVKELQKDVDRLKLVSDRFGKIGSVPKLEEVNIIAEIEQMLEYIRKRAPEKVRFMFHKNGTSVIKGRISVSIFDWVIENLLKNALDSMEGRGLISVDIRERGSDIIIDITDTGKGIPKTSHETVFKPGYTTKKRGWGLGLSLSRRIIEQYHNGRIYVAESTPGRGSTFRIVLKK